jgi:hypothetical protein
MKPAFPKPKDVKRKREAVHVFPDGRETCSESGAGLKEYRDRLLLMCDRQGWLCRVCGESMALTGASFDHEDGRGMNGSHRDDRIVKDGKPYNGAVHLKCNGEKGSKRGYGERAV